MLKQNHETHTVGCAICCAHENKYIRAQLARTSKKLLRMCAKRRLVIESSDDSEDSDE
jgi:hypothetical protein